MLGKFEYLFRWCMNIMLYEFDIGGYTMSLFGISLFALLAWCIFTTISSAMGFDNTWDDGYDEDFDDID